ncbi:MAG: hypothetical protein JWP52_4049 [Rhizobacter sp.]|jgi:hypothetical protein|nr:hypothetical protein [Rhizobacter sp.]
MNQPRALASRVDLEDPPICFKRTPAAREG